MSMIRILIATALLFAAGILSAEVRIVPQDSGVKVRLRGISAVSADIAWASGREGTVLRTVDGGKYWQTIKVPDAGELDFRDVEGFDADTAVVLSIGPGEASRVYRTGDGGKSWKLTLQNTDSRAFFDCMAFEGDKGWMLGDPVEGRFQIYATVDGGRRWAMLADLPKAAEGEAAFAASGTCIARAQNAIAFATGGSVSKLHFRNDEDKAWLEVNTHMMAGADSAGVFSIAKVGRRDILAVGGDFKKEGEVSKTAWLGSSVAHSYAVTDGQGNTSGEGAAWQSFRELPRYPATLGYRSGVACTPEVQKYVCVAAGPTGVDLLKPKGVISLSNTGYDAVDFVNRIGWLSGDVGRIARIEITD